MPKSADSVFQYSFRKEKVPTGMKGRMAQMGKQIKAGTACLLYAAAAFLFFLAVGYPVAGAVWTMLFKLGTGGLGTAAVVAGSLLLSACLPGKKAAIRRVTVGALFGLYLVVLLILLFGNAYYGRLDWSAGHTLTEHLAVAVNWRPFATIGSYWRWLAWDLAPQAVVNLGGNLAAFAPMGLFLPLLFRKLERFGWYALTVAALIVLVEVLQLFTGTGVCDVDDFLLNFAGAAAFFGACRLLPVRRLLVRLGLRESADKRR